MDYKEKYENALGRAKALYAKGAPDSLHLEEMFPELKESEDERVKNEIIAFVEQSIHCGGGTIPQEQENRWLAWLEKQGELKPIFRVGDYIRNKKTKDRVLIEQIDIANKAYCYVSRDDAVEIHSDFRFSEQNDWEIIGQKIGEQKTDKWSEEDEIGLGNALWAIEQAKTITKDENDMGNLWHAEKWLKDRVQPQNK